MEQRLQWMRQPPAAWCHWDPVRGGLQTHALIRARYPQALCHVVETAPHLQPLVQQTLAPAWWSAERWRSATVRFDAPAPGTVQMLWANMQLHMAADPQALIAHWQQALSHDGYLMFSCLGPDTLRELRTLYAELGWGAPSHAFTDMHDWGDMLIAHGFAEPVVDMEHITLTFPSAARLLQELRELGRNLHPGRFAGLRGRRWKAQLEQALTERLARPEHGGQLALNFEVIYGHAFKPAPRAPGVPVADESAVSLQDMRAMLRRNKPQ